MKDKKKSGGDEFQQMYERKLREYSQLTGDDMDGDIDLELHSMDETFPEGTVPTGTAPRQRRAPTAPDGQRLRFGVNNTDEEYEEPPKPARPSGKKKKKKKKKASRPVDHEKAPKVREEKPRKKRHPIRTFFRTVILLVLVVLVLGNLLLYKYISKVQVKDKGSRTHTNGSMNDPAVKNILLIGSDTRSEGSNGRTDSIILMTINHNKKAITLTSFMRDMYVNISGLDSQGESWDSWDKINSAYVYGGPELLMDTIEYNFDIHIDEYAYVDFYSFVEIVDAIGGIEMEISDEEAEGMKAPMGEQNKILGKEKGTDYLTSGGKKTLNGNQALAYARLRYVGNADFERTDRQKRVITQIIEKVKKSDPLTMDRFFSVCAENLVTNMGRGEMFLTAYRMMFSLKYEMKSLRIPAEGDYTYGWHNGGQSTLDIDLDACKALLKKELY